MLRILIFLIFLVSLGARALRAMCRHRADLVNENLALRQQLTALNKERARPPLDDTDRAFWVALRSSWPAWASRLVIVNADTLTQWNRERFRRYWTRTSPDATQADLGLTPRFADSSAQCRKTAGAHLVSTPSS